MSLTLTPNSAIVPPPAYSAGGVNAACRPACSGSLARGPARLVTCARGYPVLQLPSDKRITKSLIERIVASAYRDPAHCAELWHDNSFLRVEFHPLCFRQDLMRLIDEWRASNDLFQMIDDADLKRRYRGMERRVRRDARAGMGIEAHYRFFLGTEKGQWRGVGLSGIQTIDLLFNII